MRQILFLVLLHADKKDQAEVKRLKLKAERQITFRIMFLRKWQY